MDPTLQDEGEAPMMDLVTGLQTRYECRDPRHVYAEASERTERELRYILGDTSPETETDSSQ